MALKYAETVTDSITFSLAPWKVMLPGVVLQCFGFWGQEVTFRELNLLCTLTYCTTIGQNDFAMLGWNYSMPSETEPYQLPFSILKLPNHLWETQTVLYPYIAAAMYFHIAEFKWAEGMAGPSINGNWCMLGYHVWSLCKGKFTNSGKLATCWGWWCSGQTSIQGCSGPLGKCRSKQWMLGLLGPSQLELVSSLASSSCCLWLHIFRACWPHKMLSKHSGCVRHTYSLQLWFSGLYTFVTSWLNVVLLKTACWALLPGPSHHQRPMWQYFLSLELPDDMMAVQELQMTREGMETESLCLQCKLKGVEHFETRTLHQLCRNS